MRCIQLSSSLALSASAIALAASLTTSPVAAQDKLADTQWVKPMMMLLVDSSGSMERLPNLRDDNPNSLPNCASTDVNLKKNRWAIAVEALAGSFTNFQCTAEPRTGTKYNGQYDQGYFLPYHNFTSTTQVADGILDAYKDRAKFGLMTFDGVMTTSTDPNFVLLGKPGTDTTYRAQLGAISGGFSYPDELASYDKTAATPSNQFGWKPLAFPGCGAMYGVNAGAKRASTGPNDVVPGGLISIGLDESGTAVAAVNERIKQSLLSVRPFGGTPTAAMLDDFRYYMREHPDVKKGSDPYAACRKHYAILLTDGAPDGLYRTTSTDTRYQCDQTNAATCPSVDGVKLCQCPYDTEENLARKLVRDDGLDKLYVVAFSVSDAASLEALNKISQAGLSGDALQAANLTELRTQLSSILNVARPESSSRSVPVVANTGRTVSLGGKQYQITAGFRVGTTEQDPWEGRLFRQRIECDGASPATRKLSETDGDMFHLTLNKRTSTNRTIDTLAPATANRSGSLYTGKDRFAMFQNKINIVLPNGQTFAAFTPAEVGSNEQALGQEDVPVASFDKNLSPAYFGDASKNGTSGEVADRDIIHDYVRGIVANRQNAKLADIYHSNPAVMTPLIPGSDELNTFDPRLNAFYKDLLKETGTYGAFGRPGVVFVGTNDGVLHAFNLDTWKNKSGQTFEAGHEFWGFVPPALFGKMHAAATSTHQWMFDGTPVLKDAYLSPDSGVRSVLVAAVRGVPAYVALDVTNPELPPKVLWQRSFRYLGNTVATPAIAQVKLQWGASVQTRAVAILPGGEGTLLASPASCDVDQLGRGTAPDPARSKVRCWGAKGRYLYVVDVETGVLVQEFDARHFHSPMTGSVAVDGEELSLTRAAYMTDDDGILWRLSMMNVNPSSWRVAPIWDVFAGNAGEMTSATGVLKAMPEPLYAAGRVSTYPPLLTRNPANGNMNILVGTGDIDNLLDARPNRVVSLEEVRKVDSYGELAAGTIKENWSMQLDPYESVTGPIVMLDQAVYFTTFKGPPPGTSQCTLGSSRIVGAHVRDKVGNLPKPMLLKANSATERVLWETPSAAPTELLVGLNIAREPVCVAGSTIADPLTPGSPGRLSQTGEAGGGNYQLRTNVAGTGGTALDGSETGGGAQRQLSRTLPMSNVARSVGWASSIE